ncbi:hypothetical protein [Kitasatospora aureofaciens]|uniref:hypothetical protein n=1 Tax=Kitasatospora aureofaciens TaxID=1894 RepID=UPI001C44452C|nr:hypothetical protein [Kitasatospora aureofaciens]MBV6696678.1 hypothetical protein [Kitasatospora aureofaciens]
MTIVATDDPYALGTFMGAVEPLADSLHRQGVVKALSGLAKPLSQAAEHEVASVVHGFLGLDMIDLLAGGWRTHAALVEAAKSTCAAPGSEEVVALLDHRIRSVHHPTVKVLVDGVSVGTLALDIEVVFDLQGIVAVVRGGRLVAVRAGLCTAKATLAVEQITVASRQGRFDLPGGVRFRRGVVLRHCENPPT